MSELSPATYFDPDSTIGIAHLTRLYLGSPTATLSSDLGVGLPYIDNPLELMNRVLLVDDDDALDILVAWQRLGLIWLGDAPLHPCFLTIKGCRRLRDQFDACPKDEREIDFIERLRVVVMLNEASGFPTAKIE